MKKRFVSIVYMLTASTVIAQDQPLNVYMLSAPDFGTAMFNPNIVGRTILEQPSASRKNARAESGAKNFVPRATMTATTVGTVTPSMPAKLAATYPATARVEVQRVFTKLLDDYRSKIEPTFAIPKNDIAGSIAAFVAGSYMAFHNADFPDENFKPLVNQIRTIISKNTEFSQATEAEKQEMYEQMAILGMYMAGTQMALKKQPDHPQAAQIKANMRQAAKGYLEQFLKTDADRVQITANGLTLK